jgi:hypothetical protein
MEAADVAENWAEDDIKSFLTPPLVEAVPPVSLMPFS